jgi:hypothetical protein
MSIDIDVEVKNANAKPGRHLARTMHLLGDSASVHSREVRVLVYGQSISKQAWWLKVKHALQESYPQANLVMENRAIGGFHSTRLLRCAAHDIRLFYPDLILFQDYGPRDEYEEIIKAMRRETAAEIAVQTDHYVKAQNEAWHDEHAEVWLPSLCEQYALELIDVRTNWKRYLQKEGLEPEALLRDRVHLNGRGNALMATIVQAHLIPNSDFGRDPQGLVRTLKAGENFDTSASAINVDFEGNRVDLVGGGRWVGMDVLVDGKPPSDWDAIHVAERPWLDKPWPPKVGLPVRIDLGSDPKPGKWALRVRDVEDDGGLVRFEAHSEVYGHQGEGISSERFNSENGQVIIEPEAWFVRESPGFFGDLPAVEVGDYITWTIHRMGRVRVQQTLSMGKDVTLVQGLPNGPHRLSLQSGTSLPLRALRVYRPPLD